MGRRRRPSRRRPPAEEIVRLELQPGADRPPLRPGPPPRPTTRLPRPASPASRWRRSRARPAPRRWTRSPRRPPPRLRGVPIAARESGRFFGMMTTAAGTVPPAKVLVLGAGVAGLQAIATAKRLGAIVTGFDIRRAAWEQIASLGGRPLELDFIPETEAEGGDALASDRRGDPAPLREALAEEGARQDCSSRRPRPRPDGAAADHRRDRAQHAARLGDHRPRRRVRWQLRTYRTRARPLSERRHDIGPLNLAQPDAHSRETALREERREPAWFPGHR